MTSQATRRTTVPDDRGIVLAVVMMAIMLLTVIGIAAFTISAQSIADSTRVRRQTTALQAASSGLERFISIPGTPTVGIFSGQLGGGDYSVTVVQTGSGAFVNRYLYTSVGTTGSATCTVRQYVDHTWTDPWTFEIAGKKATVGTAQQLNGGSELLGSFYVVGDVDLNSNAVIGGGTWYVTGTPKFGSATTWTGTRQTLYTNSAALGANSGWTRLWSDTGDGGALASPVPPLELPYADQEYINGTYALARVESSDNLVGCSGSAGTEVGTRGDPETYPPNLKFQFPDVMSSPCYKIVQPTNTTAAPTLWNGTSERKMYVLGPKAFGRPTDDFALVSNVLYVKGTVFIDGNLTIAETVTSYVGFGTIVVNGTVDLAGKPPNGLLPLQPLSATNVLPADHLTQTTNLGIVAVGGITMNRKPYEGTLFSNAAISLGNNAAVWGSIHGAAIEGDVHSDIIVESAVVFELVPPSMPGSTTDTRPQLRRYRKVLGPWTRQ